MASDINRVVLIGRLTKDPELRQIPSGTSIASFSVASNQTFTTNGEKKETVSYFSCILWGKGGEVFAKYATKWQRISIEGKLQQRRWQDKDGSNKSAVEIVVDNFQFLEFVEKQSHQATGYEQTYPAEPQAPIIDDSDIPF